MTRQLLDASTLCSIASVCDDGRPHINTAYFAWNERMDIFWMSEPEAQHSRNVRRSGAIAIAVYDSGQVWGSPDRGIQLFGDAEELEREAEGEAKAVYRHRFSAFIHADYGVLSFLSLQAATGEAFRRACAGGRDLCSRARRPRRIRLGKNGRLQRVEPAAAASDAAIRDVHHVEINGVRLAYDDVGEGPVLRQKSVGGKTQCILTMSLARWKQVGLFVRSKRRLCGQVRTSSTPAHAGELGGCQPALRQAPQINSQTNQRF
jgi:uncharacterized protein YhbP (UPF0306 family)